MEKSSSNKLQDQKLDKLFFSCQKVDINPEFIWDEIIQLTFINNLGHVSITRLPYESEIYIEYNDQKNYIKALINDVNFSIMNDYINIEIKNEIDKKNIPNFIEIFLDDIKENYDFSKLFTILKSSSPK